MCSARIAVIGVRGMLGSQVLRVLEAGYSDLYVPDFRIGNVRQVADDLPTCDFIINCAGAIPDKVTGVSCMIRDNALLPHILAGFGVPMIHVSTDCVFSGTLDAPLKYVSNTIADATSVYGQTKALGEVTSPTVMNLRTSFIGKEHGLLAWLLRQQGSVSGWTRAMWSGSSVEVVAQGIVTAMSNFKAGTYHLATREPMSKYDLLVWLVGELGLDLTVVPTDKPVINRALAADILLPAITED